MHSNTPAPHAARRGTSARGLAARNAGRLQSSASRGRRAQVALGIPLQPAAPLGSSGSPARLTARADKRHVAARAQVVNGMTSAQKQGSQGAPVNVNCRVFTEEGANTKLELLLSFVGKEHSQVGTPVDLSNFQSTPWMGKDSTGKDVKLGVVYEGATVMPQDAVNTLLYLRVNPDAKVEMEYVNKVVVTSSQADFGITITPESWIHKAQGGRLFFAAGLALLPKQTPPELAPWRTSELSQIKGTPQEQAATRAEWDRIWDYDVYNDLAKPTEARPVLGTDEHPYPRRTRTGRAKVPGAGGEDYETLDTPTGTYWVPLDERFDTVKNTNFVTYRLLAGIPGMVEMIKKKLNLPSGPLTSFNDVDELYAQLGRKDFKITVEDFIGSVVAHAEVVGKNALMFLGIRPERLPSLTLPKVGAIDVSAAISTIGTMNKLVNGAQHLVDFPQPLVVKGREMVWDTDEEWGRQALAGTNPSSVVAVTSEKQLGAITEAHLAACLQSHKLKDLIAAGSTQPRLLVIDHTAIFSDFAAKITALGSRYGYSGRAILFQRDDDQWVPVAIELTGSEGQTTVYTPADHPNVWRLAKGVFVTIDSAFHQLVTHLLRCHSVTEPYIIATHRCLSSLHPVYKLMMPHWAFTTKVNANGRQLLMRAGSIFENTFSPGLYGLQITSKVYDQMWRFDQQALPADLEARGLAKKGADGKVQLLLKDYPYADDGMLIWDAVHEWVGKYLRCYYDDCVPEKSILGDEEIQNWWAEIQTKGHPQKEEGWLELKTIDDLTQILTTMIWVVSAHHAAVNFSMYGMVGYVLNRPPICTRPIPAKGTPAYEELIKSKESGEKVFLETLMDTNTLRAVLTVLLLSTHSDNEAYLGDPNHPYIQDEEPLRLYQAFAAKMRQVEATIDQRNKDPKYKLRNGGTAIPYEYLAPSSGPGITNRGVPQSTST